MEVKMSEMSEMFKKMGLFGIGVISLAQEKVEEFSQEMIKKGELNREEGKKLVKDILEEREKQVRDLEDKINDRVRDTLEKSGVVMKSDVAALEKKIEKLEKTIQTMTKK
jgi:polyhydroxyalkanoate synthesis regulator phasin